MIPKWQLLHQTFRFTFHPNWFYQLEISSSSNEVVIISFATSNSPNNIILPESLLPAQTPSIYFSLLILSCIMYSGNGLINIHCGIQPNNTEISPPPTVCHYNSVDLHFHMIGLLLFHLGFLTPVAKPEFLKPTLTKNHYKTVPLKHVRSSLRWEIERLSTQQKSSTKISTLI